MDTPKWIYFQNRDELLRIDLNKVVYFEADANYTNIFTNMPVFMRIGKKYIVNIRFICQIHIAKQKLVLSDFERFTFTLPASKEALKTVKELFVKKMAEKVH